LTIIADAQKFHYVHHKAVTITGKMKSRGIICDFNASNNNIINNKFTTRDNCASPGGQCKMDSECCSDNGDTYGCCDGNCIKCNPNNPDQCCPC
ncbi:20031_t:CDS:1, partial [Dentiscutata erythropus]